MKAVTYRVINIDVASINASMRDLVSMIDESLRRESQELGVIIYGGQFGKSLYFVT